MTRIVSRAGIPWQVDLPQIPVAAARQRQAIITGLAVNDASGRALTGPLQMQASLDALEAVTPGDGAFGWTARAEAVWGDGAALPATARIEVGANGFLPVIRDIALPAQPLFPDEIAPLALGTVALHPRPVTLRGRVLTAGGTPLDGAIVRLERLWHRLTEFQGTASPGTIDRLAALALGARRHRAGPGIQARTRTLSAPVASWTLVHEAQAGDEVLELRGAAPFMPGSDTEVIVLPPQAGPSEVHYVDDADPGLAPLVARMRLRHPLARAYPAEAPVGAAALGAAGDLSDVLHGVEFGDTCLCLADGAVLSGPGSLMEISGGGAPTELCPFTFVEDATDPGGFFRLEPVHRAAVVTLVATHPSQASPARSTVSLPPGPADKAVTLRFTP